jgi:hypothetical protein
MTSELIHINLKRNESNEENEEQEQANSIRLEK